MVRYAATRGDNLVYTQRAIRDAQPFDAGNLTGTSTPYFWGYLSRDWQEVWNSATPVYAVYSYRTPIAWQDANGNWVVPNVKYSVTTTRHQSVVRYALRMAGETFRQEAL